MSEVTSQRNWFSKLISSKALTVCAALFAVGAVFVIYQQYALAGRMKEIAPPLRYDLRQHTPLELGDWRSGLDENLSQTEMALIKPDQYLLRNYINTETGQRVHVFVPFTREAQQLVSHEPVVCYSGAGFIETGREKAQIPFVTRDGEQRSLAFNVVHFKKDQRHQIVMWGFLLSNKRSTDNRFMLRIHKLFQKLTGMRPNSCMKIQLDLGEIENEKAQLAGVRDLLQRMMPYLEECFPEDGG